MWAAQSGGREQNPLVPAPPSAGYLAFAAARALLALALLGLLPGADATGARRRLGRVVLWGLSVLVVVKLAAAASNAWLLSRGTALLTSADGGTWLLLVVLGLVVGEGVARRLDRD